MAQVYISWEWVQSTINHAFHESIPLLIVFIKNWPLPGSTGISLYICIFKFIWWRRLIKDFFRSKNWSTPSVAITPPLGDRTGPPDKLGIPKILNWRVTTYSRQHKKVEGCIWAKIYWKELKVKDHRSNFLKVKSKVSVIGGDFREDVKNLKSEGQIRWRLHQEAARKIQRAENKHSGVCACFSIWTSRKNITSWLKASAVGHRSLWTHRWKQCMGSITLKQVMNSKWFFQAFVKLPLWKIDHTGMGSWHG